MSPWHLAVWLVLLSGVLIALHGYLWVRLVRDTGLTGRWRGAATMGIGALAATVLGSFVLARNAPRSIASPVAWLAYAWIGVALLAVCLLGASDVIRVVATRAGAPGGLDLDRRRVFARIASLFAGGGALALSGWGAQGATAGAIIVQRVPVKLRGLGGGLDGYRIVQISDLHVGPTVGRDFLEEVVRRVNALQPDLVAITGDLVDGTVEQLAGLVAPLASLRAKDGVFFTTGNHEYYWSGLERWFVHLKELGVRVLRNERVRVGGGAGFELAGIDDLSAKNYGGDHGADLDRALAGREAGRPVVLLAHNPRQAQDARRLQVDLQLSGHTHGGQMFPVTWLVRLYEPYLAGLYALGATQLYVSRGTGYWGPPMRLGAPAEITEVILTSAQG